MIDEHQLDVSMASRCGADGTQGRPKKGDLVVDRNDRRNRWSGHEATVPRESDNGDVGAASLTRAEFASRSDRPSILLRRLTAPDVCSRKSSRVIPDPTTIRRSTKESSPEAFRPSRVDIAAMPPHARTAATARASKST